MLATSARVAGPAGVAVAWLGGVCLAVLLVAMALGLSVSEWRSAGRAARLAANATARGSRSGWRWMGFGLPMPFRLPSFRPLSFRTGPDPVLSKGLSQAEAHGLDVALDLRPEYEAPGTGTVRRAGHRAAFTLRARADAARPPARAFGRRGVAGHAAFA